MATRCALYGKLPVKRDFIAEGVPRGFLPVWEPWLQGAISASRLSIGTRWPELYLRAPIWRFWLGKSHCGATVTGALMPSVDGIGRYFPLTLLAMAEEGQAFAPPSVDPQEAWYQMIEDFLLASLDDDLNFEAMTEALKGLVPPAAIAEPAFPSGSRVLGDGMLLTTAAAEGGNLFEALGPADAARVASTATFWWTVGGEGFEPMVLSGHRLPDPGQFRGFLTGRFEAAS